MDSVNHKQNFQERVYYQVIEYIKLLVKEGKLEFGRKLPSEREMMERLGLSRNSIREALRTMEHMGLIESRQGKGNFLVNHMGRSLGSVFSMLIFMKESNYLEVSQLRRAMEAQAFDLAVGNLKEEEKEKFREIMGRIQKSDYQSMVRADQDFHKMLIETSGNCLLRMLMDALSHVSREEISIILENTTREHEAWWDAIHNRIYHCLLEGQREEGLAAIEEHYNWIDQRLTQLQTVTI